MKNINFFLLLAIFFSSCEEMKELPVIERATEDLALIDLYFKLTNEDIKISATVANTQANFFADMWDENNRASALGICYEGTEVGCSYEAVSVGEHELPLGVPGGFRKNRAPEYKSLFGREVEVKLLAKGQEIDARENPVNSTVYIPDILEVVEMGIPDLEDGFTIQWNADDDNENGVYLIIEYSPWENPRLAEDHEEKLYAYIHVEDSGSYAFQKADFADIPGLNALVHLTVLRGTFEIADLQEGGEQFRFLAYTQASGYARVK
ncbi:hypothetical protein [Phaeodactylibacter luteus]|uniref:DUF4249 family protein n=1 Tax=Phaeodactylibacter luteus TaxID=1564516 RepID=A0A5C6S200_9BACT|nr:hypothetical protein [Phaeodactylibacter luteus]TXB67890.1 hypothetical protein FRY97_03325 [Phaeodactylibacter luteus]